MKNNIIIVFIFLFGLGKAQDKYLNTDYWATYDVKYKHNGRETNEELILFMNAQKGESYFVGTNNYVLDSIKMTGKYSSSDMSLRLKYSSNFNEKVYHKNQELHVFEKIVDVKLKYNEKPNIKWTITNETKMHGSVKVIKAYANAFGRKWYAWYADNELPFGPYKFIGLPGLILVMKDEKGDFFIKLTELKKSRMKINLPKKSDYKKIKKSQLERLRYGQKVVGLENVIIHRDPKKKKEWKQGLERKFKQYPRLDIQYPYQP